MYRLPWLVAALLGAVGVGVAFLRGMTRLTIVIVNDEPFDVLPRDDDVDGDEDDLDEHDHVNRSHGYVPAV